MQDLQPPRRSSGGLTSAYVRRPDEAFQHAHKCDEWDQISTSVTPAQQTISTKDIRRSVWESAHGHRMQVSEVSESSSGRSCRSGVVRLSNSSPFNCSERSTSGSDAQNYCEGMVQAVCPGQQQSVIFPSHFHAPIHRSTQQPVEPQCLPFDCTGRPTTGWEPYIGVDAEVDDWPRSRAEWNYLRAAAGSSAQCSAAEWNLSEPLSASLHPLDREVPAQPCKGLPLYTREQPPSYAFEQLASDSEKESDTEISEEVPSIGSVLHAAGGCRSCHYFFSKQGCSNGRKCNFCHYRHQRKKSQRPPKPVREECKRLAAIAIENPTVAQRHRAEKSLAVRMNGDQRVSKYASAVLTAMQDASARSQHGDPCEADEFAQRIFL